MDHPRRATDSDVPALRRLINDAYRPLGGMGWNFTGVDQDEDITRRRMRGREVYVMEDEGGLIGTISLTVRDGGTDRLLYVNQVAVAPAHQRHGLGGRLMRFAEDQARARGLAAVRLDTAIPATHLVRWYTSRGYAKVGEEQWPGKTYRSVILEKPIETAVF